MSIIVETLSSGNGDMCFTFVSGTACYETGQGLGSGD